MPTVSIIIPTYNREHLLSRAIQSVLDQTYKDFELIIVDDGSTDNTEKLVKSFNSEKITYIRHGENKGPSAARNTGIQLAKGDYIAFQDSDNEWMLHKLEKQIMAFETVPPEVGIVYTGFFMIDNKRKYRSSAREVTTSATLVKRECFKRVGMFDERFPPAEDWELFLRMSRHSQFKCIDEPLVIRYCQSDSISAKPSALINAFNLILETYFEDIRQDKRVLASYYFTLGHLSCSCGQLGQGRSYFIRSIKTYPLDIKALSAFLVSIFGQSAYNIVAESYRQTLGRFSKGEKYGPILYYQLHLE